MRRLLWQLRRARRFFAWPTLMAIVLLAASAVAYVERGLPARMQLAELVDDAERIRRAVGLANAPDKVLSPDEQLAAFYAFFPASDAVSDVLERVFAAAAKENLALPQGEYRLVKERTEKLIRYDVTLPLKGPYPGLRRFMAQALKENPSLSLDAVSFNRQTVSDIGVDAQVRFTLYVRVDAL